MLTDEDDVEIHALNARGWTMAAISRHTGRDPKTIRKHPAGEGARQQRERAPSCLEPSVATSRRASRTTRIFRARCCSASLSTRRRSLHYPTLLCDLRRLQLRPTSAVCEHRRRDAVTVEIEHPPGEEIQWH